MRRVLVTGGSGFLGFHLARSLVPYHEVFALYFGGTPPGGIQEAFRVDIRDAEGVAALFRRLRPDFVVHTAALSKPDRCERDPAEARKVNVDGTRSVALGCRETGGRLVHISTDLVFDGTKGGYREEDPPRGLSAYARSKIEAEQAVQAILPSAAILRVAVMYGPGSPSHPGFLDAILERWRRGESMDFYTDQFRTPLCTLQVFEAIRTISDRSEVSGLFHLGGAERLSRYQFALELASSIGAPAELVRKGSAQRPDAVAPRGADCSLLSQKATETFGFRPWKCSRGFRELDELGLLPRL